MNIISKLFASEHLIFSSELDTDTLIEKLNTFCNRGFLDFSVVNLYGKVKDDGVFEFTRQWQFATAKTANTMLMAKVLTDSKGSVVNVKVTPNYTLLIVAISFLFFGLYSLICSIINKVFNVENLIVGFVFMLIGILVIVFGCNMGKSDLVDKFTETFDLKKL